MDCYTSTMIRIRGRGFLARRGAAALALAFALNGVGLLAAPKAEFRLATFSADVTVPMGHALMGGGIRPAQKVGDPLFANGWVLLGGDKPTVMVSVDWCEIRNAAYERWCNVLAQAADTDPVRVLVTTTHVHDAPVADLEAQNILNASLATGSVCDLAFHEEAVQRVAQALKESLKLRRRVTHLGLGQAKVEKVASNRRYVLPDGTVNYGRTSSTKDLKAHAAAEGTIDPWLKTLSFWDGKKPIAAMHAYAVHPMSFYGNGEVSADFVGVARARLQAEHPSVFQIYVSGCSGNVTAGKYNDGSPTNRPVLADRIYRAMKVSWAETKRLRLERADLRVVPLRLEPRNSAGFTVAEMEKRVREDPKPFGQCLAAMGLSWRKRCAAGRLIDVPAVDFGAAQLLLLPAESYVEFQLFAQQQRPESFVMVMGYGECAPGYIPIERAWQEKDNNLDDWCWVSPGADVAMKQAIEAALRSAAESRR
jgi:hypothetical protein